MKKRVLCAALASMMALSMTACSSGSTATTAAETKASEAETTTEAASSEAEETTAAAAGTEGGTLIVGFGPGFSHQWDSLGDNIMEYTGFALGNWHRKLQRRLGLEYQAAANCMGCKRYGTGVWKHLTVFWEWIFYDRP